MTSYISGIVRSIDIERDKIYLIVPLPLHNIITKVDALFGCSIEIPNLFSAAGNNIIYANSFFLST